MKTDRIFVLLLVVLLPMSGCFDDAVGDAEGADDADNSDSGDTITNTAGYNHPPVISAEITGSITFSEGSDCTTNGIQVEARHAMTDWDGNITQAGWDVNLDGTIDHVVTESEGFTMLQISMSGMTYYNYTISWTEYETRQQSVVFGAQDSSGEWASSELFLLQKTVAYTSSENRYVQMDLEPCVDFEDVTDYTFNITDHQDQVSTGNSDYLVEISRTNGQMGIDWDRVTIIIDGNNEGDETCTHRPSTSYRCWIYSGSGLTTSPVGSLWEVGDTISIRENQDLHNFAGANLEIKIMIDSIIVMEWQGTIVV
jgi:hypothetical protein